MIDTRMLTGKTILVTGGANRIGKAIAKALAKNGANIAVHYHHSKEHANQTVEELSRLGCQAHAITGDISKSEDVIKLRDEIVDRFGHLYGIVNNAGYVQQKSLYRYSPDEWAKEIDVCLNGVINLAYYLIPLMKERGEGKFISIVGDSARTGDRNLIISAAARSGVISFIKSLAQEVGRNNIQCNAVALGLIDQEDLQLEEESIQKLLKRYPLNRLGTPDDVIGIIEFLLTNPSDWVTGQVFSINGGYSMIG